MKTAMGRKSRLGGGVVGLSLGKYAFVGGGVLSLLAGPVFAGPEGGQVVRGNATISRSGDVTTIHAGHNAIINWNSFNIAGHETARFVQPDASSRVLNRISGAAPSVIDGTLLANGTVYLVNPAGVMFGKDAVINVGGIYAAAGHLSDENFLAGINHFQHVQGAVTNDGRIDAGVAHLIGKQVTNNGVILAHDAMTMVAGSDVYIGQHLGRMMVRVDATEAAAASATPASTGVTNSGTVAAPRVTMAAGDMYSLAIRNTGTVRGSDIALQGGRGGKVEVSGTLDASDTAPGRTGGHVEVLGERVVLDGATIDASGAAGGGTVLVGGDYQGKGLTPTAQRTAVSADSVVRADATEKGDGGKVIFWADDATGFFGHASARGGPEGGDGGFVEVSGKNYLSLTGTVNTSAPKGKVGTLLLDPTDVEVVAGDVNSLDDVDAFLDDDIGPGMTQIGANTIVEGLDDADVIIRATRDIIVSADIDASGNSETHDLVLEAGRSIEIGANITLHGGFTAIVNSASNDAGSHPEAAVFTMNVDTKIDTSATDSPITITLLGGAGGADPTGHITLRDLDAGAGGIFVTNVGPTPNSGIVTAGTITGGVITFNSRDGVHLGGNLVGNGEVTLNTDLNNDGNGGLGVDDGFGVTTNNHRLIISGANLNLNATGTLSSGTAEMVIGVTNNGGVGLGDGTGEMQISGSELQRITAATLTIGANGSFDVNNVTGADSANIGTVVLEATGGDSSSITFQTAASTFHALTARADGDVTVSADLTTDTGGLTLEADADGSGIGELTLDENVILDSSSNLIRLAAASLAIDDSAVISAGAADVEFLPSTASASIGIEDATRDFYIREEDLLAVSTTGAVYVGHVDGSHQITIGTDAPVDLSSKNYDLVLRSPGGALTPAGSVTFINNGLTGATNRIVNFVTGTVTGLDAPATSVTIGGATGTLRFETSGSVTMNTAVARVFDSHAGGGLTLSSTGALDLIQVGVDGAMNVAGTGAINLSQIDVNAGSLTVTAGGAVDLAQVDVQGPMSVTAGGTITDSGNLSINGAVTLKTLNNAGADITLDSAGNMFGTITAAALMMDDETPAGGDITIVENGTIAINGVQTAGNASFQAANGMTLASVNVGGNATFIAGQAITDSGALTIGGVATFRTLNDAGANITLDNTSSTFGSIIAAARNAADSADAAGDISIFQSGDMALTTVRTAGNVSFESTGAMDLGSITVGGTGTFVARGAITDSADLSIGSTSTFRTMNNAGADITLDSAGNVFGSITATARTANDQNPANGNITIVENGAMTLAVVRTAGNASFQAAGGMDLGSVQVGGAASFVAGQAITDSGATTVTGAVTFRTLNDAGAAITIDNAGSSFGSVTAEARNAANNADAPGAILIREDSTMDVAAVRTTSTVELRATDINITGAVVGSTITLRPVQATAPIALNGADATFSLSTADLGFLDASNGVIIGAVAGATGGNISIGQSGAIDLSAETYDLTLRGNAVTFTNGITLGDNRTLTFNTGRVDGSNPAVDVTIRGGNGTVVFDIASDATAGVNIDTDVDRLGASDVRVGNLVLRNGATPLTIGGQVNVNTSTATIEADSLEVSGPVNAGAIVVRPFTAGRAINLNSGAGGLDLSAAELANLNTLGAVTIGAANSGPIAIGGDGAIDLSGENWASLTLRGGALTFSDTLTLRDNSTLTLATGAITSAPAGVDVVIGGTDGSLVIDATGAVGSAANPLSTDVDRLAATTTSGGVFVTNAGTFAVATIGGVSGVTAAAGEDVELTTTVGDINGEASSPITGDTVTLTAAGEIGDTGAVATATGTLVATAGSGINISNTAPALTATLTSTTGQALLSTSGTLAMGGAWSAGSLDVRATDIDVSQPITTTGSTAIRRSTPGTMGVGDINPADFDMSLTVAELQNITANGLILGGGNVSLLTVNGYDGATLPNITGTVSVLATAPGGSVVFGPTASTFPALTATAENGIDVNAPIATTVGAMTLNGDSDGAVDGDDSIVFAAGLIIESQGAMTFSAANGGIVGTGDLTLRTLNTGADLTINDSINIAGTLNLASGGAITLNATTADVVEITSEDGITLEDDLTTTAATIINADSDMTGPGTLTVGPGATISTTGHSLRILAADLVLEGQITTGDAALTIRQSNGGPIALGASGTGMMISSEELSRMTAGSLTIGGDTTSAITVGGIDAADLQGIAGGVTLDASAPSGTVTFAGADSTFGLLTIKAGAGIALNAGLDTGGAALTINADADDDGTGVLTVGVGGTVTSSGGDLTITAADATIDGTISSGAGAFTILASGNRPVGLGATAVVDGLNLSGAELGRLSGASLTVGGPNGGSITVDGVTAAASQGFDGGVNLVAGADGGRIIFTGGASTFRSLSASADNGIAVNADVTTTAGALTFNGDADGAADGLDGITFGGTRTVTAAGTLTLKTTNGSVGATGPLTLSAGDLVLGAPLAAPGQAVTITRSSSGTIGLGDVDADAFDMTISNDELASITAGSLTIGGDQTTLVEVNSVPFESADGIAGVLTLRASADGGRVRFVGGASEFVTLTVQADDGVDFDQNVTARLGAMDVDGDLDDAPDTRDSVMIAGDVELSAGGALTIRATTGGIRLTGGRGTTNVMRSAADQALTLDRVTADAGASLTLTSQGILALSGVDLGTGDFTATADVDSDTDGVTFSLQDITAHNIVLSAGTDNNDTILISTDFAAGGNLIIRNASVVELAGDVDLTAGGHINLAEGVGTLRLTGAAGTTNILEALGDGAITLSNVTATNNANLVLRAEDTVAISSLNIGSGSLTINIDTDNDGENVATLGSLTAGSITASGTGSNDNLTINGDLTASGAGGITLEGGAIVLHNNLTASAGPVTLTGFIRLTNDVTVDTSNADKDVSFQGLIDGEFRLTVDAGSGNVLFGGAVGSSTPLTGLIVSDAGGLRFDGNVAVGTHGLALSADSISLGGSVNSVGDVTFSGPLTLTTDVTIAGNDVTFSGTINSDTTARALRVETSGNGATSFGGVVGGTSPLASLFTNADGTTRLGTNIFTTGGMTFLDAVTLTGDVLLRDTGATGIAFGGTINSDSSSTPRGLTLLVNTDTSGNPLATPIPVISFGGNVGATAALSYLRLNYDEGTGVDGRSTPTAAATIVARPLDATGQPIPVDGSFDRNFGVSINAQTVTMGFNEKFTSLGGLSITASNQARLGDLTAAGDLVVNSPSIVLRARNAGGTLDKDGLPDFDTGLDIVGRTVNFAVTPTIEGEGFPPVTFGTEDGTGDVAGTLTMFSFRSFGSTDPENLVLNNVPLDARSVGPTNTNIAPTIAGAIPRERQSGDISQDTTVGQSQQEQLRQLGIFARELRLDEFLAFLVGRSIYDDYPTRPDPDPIAGGYQVAVTRLAADRVEHLLATYDSIYNRDVVDENGQAVVDPQTGRTLREPRTEEIREALQLAVREYRRTSESREFDPVGFRAYLEQTPEHAEALEFIEGLRDLLTQLELIGLTPLEFSVARDTLLKEITPRGIRAADLQAVVTGQPAVPAIIE